MPPWLQELRQVLLEHDWNVQDALQALQVFSDPGASTTAQLLPSYITHLHVLLSTNILSLLSHNHFQIIVLAHQRQKRRTPVKQRAQTSQTKIT